MEYDIKKVVKEVFKAHTQGEKNIIEYELEKKENGWTISYTHYNVDAAYPDTNQMYLPNNIIKDILLKEFVKEKLKD